MSRTRPATDGAATDVPATGATDVGATDAGSTDAGTTGMAAAPALAVVVARLGRLPLGADEAIAEAGGRALVVGQGAAEAAASVTTATDVWWWDSGTGLAPARLAATLAPVVVSATVVVLPGSPDGRDLAPRLAVALRRPLLAQATEIRPTEAGHVDAVLSRLDGHLSVPVTAEGPAVATLIPGVRTVVARPLPPRITPLHPGPAGTVGGADPVGTVGGADPMGTVGGADPVVVAVVEADTATMDLSEAGRVLSGGAGLVRPDAEDGEAVATFELLTAVAARLGASAGATRVVTDAGWMSYDRQIGTTGITVHPDLYVAFGVSGAAQHTGGIGAPGDVVSVNTDASCPMTALADLGLVTDARALLIELAQRLDVPVPAGMGDATRPLSPTGASA